MEAGTTPIAWHHVQRILLDSEDDVLPAASSGLLHPVDLIQRCESGSSSSGHFSHFGFLPSKGAASCGQGDYGDSEEDYPFLHTIQACSSRHAESCLPCSMDVEDAGSSCGSPRFAPLAVSHLEDDLNSLGSVCTVLESEDFLSLDMLPERDDADMDRICDMLSQADSWSTLDTLVAPVGVTGLKVLEYLEKASGNDHSASIDTLEMPFAPTDLKALNAQQESLCDSDTCMTSACDHTGYLDLEGVFQSWAQESPVRSNFAVGCA